jgi:hypothetical protein
VWRRTKQPSRDLNRKCYKCNLLLLEIFLDRLRGRVIYGLSESQAESAVTHLQVNSYREFSLNGNFHQPVSYFVRLS